MLSRLRPRLNHATVVAYLALFVALGGGALAAKSFLGSDGQLHGCVSKSGKLKLVHSASSKCPKHNSKIAWTQKGPSGAPGTPGEPGARGPSAISINTPPYTGTSQKTVATVAGLDVKLTCGGGVDFAIEPSTSGSGGVLTEGYDASDGSSSPIVVDDSSASFGASVTTNFLVAVIMRRADRSDWTRFDLIAHRNAGDNSCTLRGLIIPSS
ncbi:MAG: hypothetical protein QOD53_2498 [Thermoleophilaceae bacterium]|jgi:hypothetical protein|nr:hypothetical protein [Thermoleophilaceae bacterium]